MTALMSRLKLTTVVLTCVFTPLLLTACSKPANEAGFHEQSAQDTATTPSPEPSQTAAIPDAPQLAYQYRYTLSAAEDHLKALMQTHENACLMAGAMRCQILSSAMASDQSRGGQSEHILALRASPEWLRLFRDGLEAQVQTLGGQIVAQSINGEDLAPAMVDTEAHIINKTALRDRLKEVVRTRNGKISDVIQAETQLSEVQGEIDTARARAALLQKQVRMSTLTLTYRLNSLTTSRGTFAPLGQAVDNIVPTFVNSLSLFIQSIAGLLPLGLIAGPIIWFVLRRKSAARRPQPGGNSGE
jgi:hypothetical protein